jgi:hypothetical protein
MNSPDTRRIPRGLCMLLTLFAGLTTSAAAQTSTTQTVDGKTTTTTKQRGTVTYVEGNNLVIKMSTGELRSITVPDGRTALIDGKEVTIHDLKVGTTLTASITTTTTPVVDRTVSNITGTVWYVAAPTVILTLADGTNKLYKTLPGYKFSINGQPATVFQLKKGMMISAERIVEQPSTVIASNTTVTGHVPAPKVAQR